MEVRVPVYGSDRTGLVCGYLFEPGVAARAIESEEAEHWLQHESHRSRESFLWLHFSLVNTASEKWLGANLGLPEAFYDSLREGPRSTRVEHVDDALVAVLNDVRYDFSFDSGDISTLWLSVQQRVMVSARVKSLRAIDRLRASVKGGEGFRSPVELLAHLLRDQADGLVQIVREATARVDRVEDDLLAQKVGRKRAQLGSLRRLLVRLQRLLAPEPAALFRLLNRPPEWIAEEDLRELRESAEEFSTAIADASALVERIRLIQEELATLINEQNNKSLFVLTIVTVLALPINIIAGLFGMNVGGIPLAQHGSGFWVVVAIVATFTAVAGAWVFRKRGDG